MWQNQKYRNTIWALITIGSLLMLFIILLETAHPSTIESIVAFYQELIGTALLGGIIIIWLRVTRKRHLKHSFLYNLIGSFNIIIAAGGFAQGHEKRLILSRALL